MNRINPIKRIVAFGMALATTFSLATSAFAAPVVPVDKPVEVTSYQEVSQDMAMEIWKQYIAEAPMNISSIATKAQAASFVDGYVQYAVDNGYIEDTPAQRASIGVAFARGILTIAANAGGLAYPIAGEFLKHSLQDNPEDLVYDSSSSCAEKIANSTEFQALVDDAKSFASSVESTTVGQVLTDSTTLQSTVDLLLAFRAVGYTSYLKRDSSNKNLWHFKVVFEDTYDFDSGGWSDVWDELKTGGLIQGGAEVLNMVAEAAMDIGAIVEYDIEVTVETSFYCV